jgi:uncharacterized membrane protein
MATTRGLERLIFFTDAVAAIAITVLILPIVDAVPGAAANNLTVLEFLTAHWPQLLTFLISFLVIARLWTAHHAIFEHVVTYNGRLVQLSLLWSLTVVFLPLPTALTTFTTDGVAVALYIGTMALSSIVLTAITLMVRGNPELEDKDNPIRPAMVLESVWTSVGFLVALLLGSLVPVINYWALLLLMLEPALRPLVSRKHRKAATSDDGGTDVDFA